MPQAGNRSCHTRREEFAGPTWTYVLDYQSELISDVRHFITAKQHENVSIHALVQGIAINDITWLAVPNVSRPNPQEASKRRKLVEELVTWLFEGYLVPLLRVGPSFPWQLSPNDQNTFYATETAATRYKIVYYPHEAWSSATRPHFAHLQDTFLQELDSVCPCSSSRLDITDTQNERYFAHQGPLGVAVVRLIPKPNGFRPIVNLGRAIVSRHLNLVSIAKTCSEVRTHLESRRLGQNLFLPIKS
jgi:telomerase reverse transcriptase